MMCDTTISEGERESDNSNQKWAIDPEDFYPLLLLFLQQVGEGGQVGLGSQVLLGVVVGESATEGTGVGTES
jgi:hypothetical protein